MWTIVHLGWHEARSDWSSYNIDHSTAVNDTDRTSALSRPLERLCLVLYASEILSIESSVLFSLFREDTLLARGHRCPGNCFSKKEDVSGLDAE